MAAFDSVDAAGAGVTAVIASGIIPAGLELLDKPAIDAVEQFIHTGYPKDAAAILLCELDGTQADVTAQVERVNQVFTDVGAIDLQVSHNEEERLRFWAGRKAAFPAMGRLSPDYYCMDGTIPRKHLAQVLNRIGILSEEYGLPICNVFHAGDGNLHPLILYDANKPGELERTEELGGKILEICVEVGGTITGEHGVGLEKINQMCVQFNAAELQQFHAIKSAFDADNLLNPGKAIPTLHRCAEFGAMHVHHGELPHPELERF
jgi:glycolate oxidase